jgi:hypothetical protein
MAGRNVARFAAALVCTSAAVAAVNAASAPASAANAYRASRPAHPLRVAGDIDGDGRSDLVIAGSTGVQIRYSSARPGGSRVQELTVSAGALSTMSVADVNGDGYADVVVGDSDVATAAGTAGGGVYVWYGTRHGVDPGAVHLLRGPLGGLGLFGTWLTTGDVNGDGIADVVVGVGTESLAEVGVDTFVLFGTRAGLSTAHEKRVRLPGVTSGAVGDLNGDGHPDLVLGRPATGAAWRDDDGFIEDQEGTLAVYYGTRSGLPVHPTLLHGLDVGVAYGALGTSTAIAKINGDRYADLVAGAPTTNLTPSGVPTTSPFAPVTAEAGSVVVLYGGRHGLRTSRRTNFDVGTRGVPGSAIGADDFGAQLATGDTNGDGFADIIVSRTQEDNGRFGSVYVFRGSSRGVSTSRVKQFLPFSAGQSPIEYEPMAYGSTLTTFYPHGGRYASVAVGAPGWAPSGTTVELGFVDVFPGSKAGATVTGKQRYEGAGDRQTFGLALAP